MSQTETDRQIRARTGELNRALEQQLANRRAQGDGQRLQMDIQDRLIREVQKQQQQHAPEPTRK